MYSIDDLLVFEERSGKDVPLSIAETLRESELLPETARRRTQPNTRIDAETLHYHVFT